LADYLRHERKVALKVLKEQVVGAIKKREVFRVAVMARGGDPGANAEEGELR
jgi:hypothetical protein